MLTPENWLDYELLDMSGGEKLERWGNIVTVRPDPQIIWRSDKNNSLWKGYNMRYRRSHSGGGSWEIIKAAPSAWNVRWRSLKFIIRPTDFKHMGLFPEQAANWHWSMELISREIKQRPVKVLNLFAYTGGATCAAAKAGAHVTHVDAAKGMNEWAKQNTSLSGIPVDKLRFITDDVLKFVEREQRRGSVYDAIIMDPPSYGRGSGGEVWKIEDRLYELVERCERILADKPLFFLINSYTSGFSPIAAANILKIHLKRLGGTVTHGEVGIKSADGLILPCGIYARWNRYV